MPTGSVLRPAVPADIPRLLALESSAFESDRLSARSFKRLLIGGNCACAAAIRGDALAGYSLTLFRNGAFVSRLHSLAVDPALRGQGIGRALLDEAEAGALRRNARVLRLAVRADNQAATALYKSSGYQELGTESAYYADGMSARIMEKLLGEVG
jgi:ribosomal protein S18 acetylase RimI-like enzyme